MKIFARLAFSMGLCALSLVGCKETKEKANTQTTATETTESTTEKTTTTMASTKVLNANLATAEELASTGLAQETITQIIEKRPFLSLNDFNALLAEETDKEALYQKIFVPLNLNTTPEADFKMIPGVGDRMAHEFEEYRPYVSLAQFRKEIGKYVDDKEVARYENYVFVPVELNTASEEVIKDLPGVGSRMAHEFEEYRPYKNMAQFRKEIGKYVDDKELNRLERLVYLKH